MWVGWDASQDFIRMMLVVTWIRICGYKSSFDRRVAITAVVESWR